MISLFIASFIGYYIRSGFLILFLIFIKIRPLVFTWSW